MAVAHTPILARQQEVNPPIAKLRSLVTQPQPPSHRHSLVPYVLAVPNADCGAAGPRLGMPFLRTPAAAMATRRPSPASERAWLFTRGGVLQHLVVQQ